MQKTFHRPFISAVQAEELLKQYGSPLFLYDADRIKNKCSALTKAAEGFHISYAMKANSNTSLLKLLQESGVTNVDVVSPGEIYKAKKAGYEAENILYTENFISEEELNFALKENVIMNIGALDTLRAHKEKLKGRKIFVRINPQLGAGQTYQVITGGPKSKFGIYFDELDEVLKIAKSNQIQIVGLHQHIGSNLKSKDEDVFVKTVAYIFEKSKQFPDVKYINIGGGIGIQYKAGQILMDIQSLYHRVRQIRDNFRIQTGRHLDIWIEPGRFLVGDSGLLLCNLTAKKKTPEKIFYGTNTGFNHLLRPALYGSHHEIINLSRPDCVQEKVTVCGNICECSDNLGNQIQLGGQIGDILCIENAGAYAFSMSSNYNERLRPAQILKDKEQFKVIRRRETFQDLLKTENF